MEIVNRNVVGSKPDIGRIDLLPDYTLFDVRKNDARKVIDALRNVDFFGTTIRPEIASDRDYSKENNKKKKIKVEIGIEIKIKIRTAVAGNPKM